MALIAGSGILFYSRSIRSVIVRLIDFVMATGYIMCQKEWRWQRIVKLWLQVVGYSLALVIIGLVVLPHGSISWRNWLQAIFPISTNRYWFVTQYFALFFAMPFLNVLTRTLKARESLSLVVGGFVLLTIYPILAGSDLFVLNWGYSFVWFLYLYLTGAYVRNHGIDLGSCGRVAYLLLFVAFSMMSGGCVMAGRCLAERFGAGARIAELGCSYASPTILLESVCLVLLCSKIDVQRAFIRQLIAAVAPSVFVVYVVHSNGVFKELVGWDRVFLSLASYPFAVNILLTICISAVIFVAIVFIDWGRRCLLSK